MKFNGPKAAATPIKLTVEDIIIMHEQEAKLRAEATAVLDDPINSFITVAGRAEKNGVKASIESLSAREVEELSSVLGVGKSSLESMSVDEFVGKCNECIGASPAQEDMRDFAFALLGYFIGRHSASASTKKVASKEFVGDFKNIIDAIPSNKKADAMRAFTVTTWKYNDWVDRIGASNKALDYCEQSIETIFEDDNLVELEKIADALGSDPVRYENEDDQLKAWSEWASKGWPRETAKTLGELGFSADKLTDVVQKLHDFSVRYTAAMTKFEKGAAKHTKRGFLTALGEMFSKKKADEGARKREMANAKYYAMKCIMDAVYISTNGLCADIIVIGDKARRLAKADA